MERLLVIPLLLLLPPLGVFTAERRLTVKGILQCIDHPDLPVQMLNFTTEKTRNDFIVNGVAEFKEDVTGGTVKIKVGKECPNSNGRLCDEVPYNFVNADLCTLLGMKDQVYTRMLMQMQPPLQCPLKKGFYRFNNATINHTLARFIKPSAQFYYIGIIGYSLKKRNRMLFCATLLINSRQMRS